MIDPLANWRRAVEREQLIRDASFLPATEDIGPFEAMPLTLRHYLSLRVIGSPFIVGGTPTEDDAAAFLWAVNPKYHQAGRGRRKFVRECRWFTRPRIPLLHTRRRMRHYAALCVVRLERFQRILDAIREYITEAEQDWPSSVGEPGPSYWSDAANLCDTFGAEYGWPVHQTMNTPIKVLFQLLKLIRSREKAKAGKQPILFNPSDRERGIWLDSENEKEINGDDPGTN